MVRITMRNALGLAAALALLGGVTGCFRVHVDKDANGDDKNVQVDTPFGGVHVNTNQTSASDLGLPAYPGAKQVADDDKHKSADVHLGFGEWELRVRAVSYGTADTQDQVLGVIRAFGEAPTEIGAQAVPEQRQALLVRPGVAVQAAQHQ